MPAILSHAGKEKLLETLCTEELPHGVMYVGVLHVPEGHNHPQNYHYHIIFYDRPCRYLPELDCWDHEYAVEGTDSRGRRKRTFPFRQPKIKHVVQPCRGVEGSGKRFVEFISGRFAEVTNMALTTECQEPNYDHRSFSDRGLDDVPTKPLGSKAAALERAGIPTDVGRENAAILWPRWERFELAEVGRWCSGYDKLFNEAADALEGAPRTKEVEDLRRTLAAFAAEQSGLRTRLEQEARFRVAEMKIRSRALKVSETCERELRSIETGTATTAIRAAEPLIRARLDEAQDWLAGVDLTLEPYRLAIADERAALDAVKLQWEERKPGFAALAEAVQNVPRIPANAEDQIASLLRLIGHCRRMEKPMIVFRGGKANSNVANDVDKDQMLQEVLDNFYEDARVRQALRGLQKHLAYSQARLARFDALVELEAPLELSPSDIGALRRAVGNDQTLFAARNEADRLCLTTDDPVLGKILTAAGIGRDAPLWSGVLDLVCGSGEVPLRSFIVEPVDTGLSYAVRSRSAGL